jgi:DNA-binding transcriptional MerR regulator
MAYTVKEVVAMSGVSVRTLHFYDEIGLLKPAFHGANGYRFYREEELLRLQQILFYRELGFELKQIKEVLDRPDFEKIAALESHRKVLQEELTRTRTLVETIDKTIEHLKGEKTMKSEELFAGFHVAAGKDRFDKPIRLGGDPNDCKLSGRDTNGAMCIFEFTGRCGQGGPKHVHLDQDEWIYVIQGEFEFQVGDKRIHATAGESVFLPRKVAHVWAAAGDGPGKLLDVYQPAGKIEEFFRELSKYSEPPLVHEALSFEGLSRLFRDHGLEMVGPPMLGEWKVEEDGRIVQVA